MDYRELKWGELKSFAKSQGINTKGMKKVDIYEALDSFNDEQIILKEILIEEASGDEIELHPFKGIKEHPLFEASKEILPYLKAFQDHKIMSAEKTINNEIARIFLTHIETDKAARFNLSCGSCKEKMYYRMVVNYNRIAEEHGRSTI